MDKCLLSSNIMTYSTPDWLYDSLNKIFEFKIDLAADQENTKCKIFYTENDNSLNFPWGYEGWNWLNPPYGRTIKDWVGKAYTDYKNGADICMLIPARTDTTYFHKYIIKSKAILLLKGRLKFGNEKNSAPFPSMLVFFGNIKEWQINKLNNLELGFLILQN